MNENAPNEIPRNGLPENESLHLVPPDRLPGALADTECWLADWVHERVGREDTGDIREINCAATTLHRLIEARRKLRGEQASHDEAEQSDGTHDDVLERIRVAIAKFRAGRPDDGDPDTLPD